MKNKVAVCDNGAAFLVTVNGMIVEGFNTLGGAWDHIAWMYRIARQDFVVGDKETPAKEWVDGMIKNGYLRYNAGMTK